MKLFKVFLSFFVLAGLFFGVSLFFPGKYKIEREVLIKQPVVVTYHFMQDFKNWHSWSAWNKTLDTSLYVFYGKHSESAEARQYFYGQMLGSGRFNFTTFIPNNVLSYNLYMHGGEASANGTFYFYALDSVTTRLCWVDSGDVGYNPIFRYMIPSKVSSTEKAFDEGLQRIKSALEVNANN
jgi:hypothetical protein